jgi:hypothetical protein
MSPRKHQPKEIIVKAESSPWTEPFQRAAEQAPEAAAQTAPRPAQPAPASHPAAAKDNPTREALSAIFGS